MLRVKLNTEKTRRKIMVSGTDDYEKLTFFCGVLIFSMDLYHLIFRKTLFEIYKAPFSIYLESYLLYSKL